MRQSSSDPPAIEAIEKITSTSPSPDAETIWRCVEATIERGSAAAPRTKEEMDELHGVGRWRPMPTFLVVQGCGKERVINDARAGEQNDWSEMPETIFTISVDFIATATHTVLDRVRAIWTGVQAYSS